jgi:uncharacterized SAM-binding protein YcdF (DUF218 family)
VFVFLSKLFPLFIYPVSLVCILAALALLLTRRPVLARWLLAFVLMLLLLGGNSWVAAGLERSLENQYRPPDPIPRADVIVVLGTSVELAGPPRLMTEINGAGDRLLAAARLYHQGAADAILVTDGMVHWATITGNPAQESAALLQYLGVPAEAIWLDGQSQNTLENARNSARILKEKGAVTILLVTSAWHMPRSVRLFQAQGLQVTPVPVDYSMSDAEWEALRRPNLETFLLGLFPTADNLQMTTKIMKEYLGLLTYSIRGWK